MASEVVNKKATRSRRVDGVKKEVISKTGVSVSECYCRMHMSMLSVSNFYQATDLNLDKIGFMSICKEHVSQMYSDFYRSEKSMGKVLLRMCRILNVIYSDDIVASTRLHLQTQGKPEDDGSIFGIYKSKCVSNLKENVNATSLGLDLTFKEPILSNEIQDSFSKLRDDTTLENENIKRLRQFWGNTLEVQDYEWLEFELSQWKNVNKKIARNEESLLQLIVLKLFDIRKARDEGRDTTTLEASYQKLLDTSGLRPKDINISVNNKQDDNWGSIVEMVEKTTPAEYYKDKKLFANFDGLLYFKNYIIRSIINFVTFNKNFELSNEITSQDEADFSYSESLENEISSDNTIEEGL